MIIPEYWAEAKTKYRKGNRRITIQRFGWSDISQEDAQNEAEKRTEQALQDWLEGKVVKAREKKVYYNGADGLPIREQVISKHDDIVITRNSYGALCLNTPDVMFADIDIEELNTYFSNTRGCMMAIAIPVLIIITLLLLGSGNMTSPFTVIAVIALIVCIIINKKQAKDEEKKRLEWLREDSRKQQSFFQNKQQEILTNIQNFSRQYPQWGIRIYQTPAGLRLLITHQTFDPADEQVTNFFDKMGVDTLYSRMCKNQHCFRARVSPKPWRIGISKSISSSRRVWPFSSYQDEKRQKWLVQYEGKATDFASCRFIKAVGNPVIAPKVAQVIALHDQLSQAQTDLPIA